MSGVRPVRGARLALTAAVALLLAACAPPVRVASLPAWPSPRHDRGGIVTGEALLSDALDALPAAPGPARVSAGWLHGVTKFLTTVAEDDVESPFRPQATNHRLAAALNAHLAWSLTLAALPETRDLPLDDIGRVRLPVARRATSLAELAAFARALAPTEPRLGLFLNPGRAGWPPWPRAAPVAESVDMQLAEHAERCGRWPGAWQLAENSATLAVPAGFLDLDGLPAAPVARVRRLLDLVPPARQARDAILARCGDSLGRCRISFTPATAARARIEVGGEQAPIGYYLRPTVGFLRPSWPWRS